MSRDTQKRQLLRKLARGITYTGPMLAVVVGASAIGTATAAEVNAESEYMMLAAGEAEAEDEAKGEADSSVTLAPGPVCHCFAAFSERINPDDTGEKNAKFKFRAC